MSSVRRPLLTVPRISYVSSCKSTANAAVCGASAYRTSQASGGAIALVTAEVVPRRYLHAIISDCVFDRNTVHGGQQTARGTAGKGGAIVFIYYGNMTVKNSVFSGNRAFGGDATTVAGNGFGGAMSIFPLGAAFHGTDLLFVNNSAMGGSALRLGGSGSGGSIFVEQAYNPILKQSLVCNFQRVVIKDSTVIGGSGLLGGRGIGGGIMVWSPVFATGNADGPGTVLLRDFTLNNTHAVGGVSYYGGELGFSVGGGIAMMVNRSYTVEGTENLQLFNGTVFGSSTGNFGSGIFAFNCLVRVQQTVFRDISPTVVYGGAIAAISGSVNILLSDFSKCATNLGGAGGAIFLYDVRFQASLVNFMGCNSGVVGGGALFAKGGLVMVCYPLPLNSAT